MTRNLILLVLGAAALAACNSESHTIVANEAPDPMAEQLANAPAVELPPAIAASKTYRCKDNSLLYIDWYSDGSARVKTEKGTGGTHVPAPAEGVKSDLTGTAQTPSINYGGKNCHI
jgi:hypothetical protein